ncbi:MAG: type II secretion system protein, partial [Lentisphaerae bacterium]|nr:type II secretion system protein [Lentisphaerota bacterium]
MRRTANIYQSKQHGFTLLEILLAVSLLAIVSTLTYLSFSTITTAWKRGLAMTDELHHGDFVMEQLVMGLRSAYYPEARNPSANYGFWLENNG